MTDIKCENPGGLSPVALAFVGDGVFELMVRERLVAGGGMPAGKLHQAAVGRVNATAQALAYDGVLAACSDQEAEILRRGKNVSLSRIPKSCTPQEYHRATAIEALLGYLYLSGDKARLEAMFALIEEEIARGKQAR
ncbi:MAG: ribonuclease III [Oscillospiraceae bacterium]|nr:ribonuclease III [Oscillospiraceae bacterium]